MAYRLASLDMAGTTFDERGIVYDTLRAAVADAAGQAVPQGLLERWTGTSKSRAIAALLTELGSQVPPAAVYAEFESKLTQAYRDAPPAPFDGVPEVIRRLRESGVKVALQTGYARPVAELLLDAANWRIGRDIDAVVCSDEVPASRPAPYLIFRTMEATGVDDVRDVLVAGDTPNDLGAGIRAGAGFVVAVLSGAHDEAELSRCPHTHIVSNVVEIADL